MLERSKPYTHDATKFEIVFGPIVLEDFWPGEYFRIIPRAPKFTSKLGIGGAVVPIMTYDRRADLELDFMKESPSNLKLSIASAADQLSGKGTLPFLARYVGGMELYTSVHARIIDDAPPTRGKATTKNTWKFELYRFINVNGGM